MMIIHNKYNSTMAVPTLNYKSYKKIKFDYYVYCKILLLLLLL